MADPAAEMDVEAVEPTQPAALESLTDTAPENTLALPSLTCTKSGVVLTAENLGAEKSARHVETLCKSCTNVTAMLRNLSEMPQEWSLMDSASQKQFFEACCKAKDESLGPISYKQVRAELVKSLSQTKMSSEAESLGGGYFPIEYWEKQGFPRQQILDHAPRKEHSFLGTVYQVPIHHQSVEQKTERFERSVLAAERAVRKRCNPELALLKGKAAKAAAEKAGIKLELSDQQKALKDSLSSVIDLQSDSDDENLKACDAGVCFLLL